MKQFFLFCAVSMLVASCSTTETIIEEVSDEINIPDRIVSGRAKSYAYNMDRSDSTLSQIDYQYYTPQFSSGIIDSAFKEVVNARIVQLVSMGSPDNETELLGPLTDFYFERVVNDFTVNEADDDDEMDMWRWEMQAGFEIKEYKDYVLLTSGGWEYTGGAHGNGYTFFEYYSKEDGELLTTEYFVADYDALLGVAEKHFRVQQEIEEGASINSTGCWFENDQFALNENFFFAGGEMIFLYNSYEIAPYAAGVIELRIPLSELEGIVKQ